jgi:hypothetical protein
MNEWFRRDIMDGIYLDGFTPWPDTNHETGTAYLLPDGKVQPGNAFFGYRNYLKRLHAILTSLGKPPLITIHGTNTMPMPMLSFAGIYFDGEDVARFRDDDVTFIDAWPLDRLMTLDSAQRSGLVTVLMLKGEYATRGRDPIAWAHMIRRMYRSSWAIWLLFDMNVAGVPPGERLGGTIREYQGDDVKVRPFWSSQSGFRTEVVPGPSGADEKDLPKRWLWPSPEFRQSIGQQPLRTTLYVKRDRALAVVANFLRRPVRGRLILDLAAFGIPKEQQATVAIRDVDDWPRAEGEDIQKMGRPAATEDQGLAPSTDTKPHRDLDLGEPELDADRNTVKIRDGAVDLEVPGHDFRAVELRWTGE